ncbi:MAG TPA: 30S ribosomal protein S2 [Oligoflexia bacterium]|nr:30S ribosomal protein S2 [Oligoflexia bacterium]HMP27801.1 30S ribosomal protein S2 [Oligoflexia bacterium]
MKNNKQDKTLEDSAFVDSENVAKVENNPSLSVGVDSDKNQSNQQTQSNSPLEIAPRDKAVINVKTLIEAGAHFGHQSAKWNPKMLPYIFGAKNNIHIINLDLTVKFWERAKKALIDLVSQGGEVLIVGTKQQVGPIVELEARRCGAFYVNKRWLGGCLTNFQTIRKSIERMSKLEDFLHKAEQPDSKLKISKKERLTLKKELDKLKLNLEGIRNMRRVPDLVFVVDTVKEEIAVAEARKLKIPVMALIDTNSDPDIIDFPIPANDDASRTVTLLMQAVADCISEGRALRNAVLAARELEGAKSGGAGLANSGQRGARRGSSKQPSVEVGVNS